MGFIRKVLIHLFLGASGKTHSQFCDVIFRTTKELDQFDAPLKNLLVNWLVSSPWAFFEELFINKNLWNEPLLKIFQNAQVINGEECSLVTQAFCLCQLEKLAENRDEYKKYSINEIEKCIDQRMTKGILLTKKFKKFKKGFTVTPPDEWLFEYIREILNILYSDNKKTFALIRGLEYDLKLRLALSIYFTEFIKATIQNDKRE